MKIGIAGCAGRMGRMLVATLNQTEGCQFIGGIEATGHPLLGQDASALAGLAASGHILSDQAEALFGEADAVIDFTLPQATEGHAALAAVHGTRLVVGTTGLATSHLAALQSAAAQVAIVHAPNFSLGVNVLIALSERVAASLGDDYDIEIVEMHHRHKVDAPSGTALGLGQAVARGRAVDLDQVAQRVRDGHTGPRRRGDIGFATLRGGDVVGDHSVVFAGLGERIELTHKAASREIFARGAVRAALWSENQPAGFYSMLDVLGF